MCNLKAHCYHCIGFCFLDILCESKHTFALFTYGIITFKYLSTRRSVTLGHRLRGERCSMENRRFSLKTIYLTALTAVLAFSFIAFVAFDANTQQKQIEQTLLEEARMFAREMDAVWQFMDNSQDIINNTTDGDYEFKGLHCAVVGRSVGKIFSINNDYTIRYTNFNPRSEQDIPDEFEEEALTLFNEDASQTEYYGIASYKDIERFRYVRALQVNDSCLECHGSPVGEIDITGHAKEGWTLDSVGGAISIVIPVEQQTENLDANMLRDMVFFLGITTFIGLVIYVVTTIFVLKPLRKMHDAFDEMGQGRLRASVWQRGAAREMRELSISFNEMSDELGSMYENLESQVQKRTHDLSEANKLLEQQRDRLTLLNEKLEKETQFKSDLLSMVNHELRTPLTSIIAFAQTSYEKCSPDNERDRRAWAEIEKNSQVLLNMINNMLDIARTDAGSIGAVFEPVSLGDIIASVKTTLEPLVCHYAMSFEVHVDADVPLVIADAEKLERMLQNLTSNAIKYTPDGGSLAIHVSYNRERNEVIISVADNGIGIAPEDHERIFERFVQVGSTAKRRYNGTGLGLALVREYANIQGFSVSVQSALDEGSTFIITIPADSIVRESDE